jgi:hypothetical protein
MDRGELRELGRLLACALGGIEAVGEAGRRLARGEELFDEADEHLAEAHEAEAYVDEAVRELVSSFRGYNEAKEERGGRDDGGLRGLVEGLDQSADGFVCAESASESVAEYSRLVESARERVKGLGPLVRAARRDLKSIDRLLNERYGPHCPGGDGRCLEVTLLDARPRAAAVPPSDVTRVTPPTV